MASQQPRQQPRQTRKERPTALCQVFNREWKGNDTYEMVVQSAHGERLVVETKAFNGNHEHLCGEPLSYPGFPEGTTCQMGFSTPSQLTSHKKVYHDQIFFECQRCHALRADGSNYDKHIRKCLGLGEEYPCRKPHCTKVFGRSDNRRRHERKCRGDQGSPAVEAEEAEDSDFTASTPSAAAAAAPAPAPAPAAAPEQQPLPPLMAPVSPVPLPEFGFTVPMEDLEEPPMFTGPPVTNQQLYDTDEAPLFEDFEADGALMLQEGLVPETEDYFSYRPDSYFDEAWNSIFSGATAV